MSELKSASIQSTAARAETEAAEQELSAQIAALRDDLSKLSDSVVAISQGAKTVVTEEAALVTARVRDKVREEPLFALAVTAGVAYVVGLLSRR